MLALEDFDLNPGSGGSSTTGRNQPALSPGGDTFTVTPRGRPRRRDGDQLSVTPATSTNRNTADELDDYLFNTPRREEKRETLENITQENATNLSVGPKEQSFLTWLMTSDKKKSPEPHQQDSAEVIEDNVEPVRDQSAVAVSRMEPVEDKVAEPVRENSDVIVEDFDDFQEEDEGSREDSRIGRKSGEVIKEDTFSELDTMENELKSTNQNNQEQPVVNDIESLTAEAAIFLEEPVEMNDEKDKPEKFVNKMTPISEELDVGIGAPPPSSLNMSIVKDSLETNDAPPPVVPKLDLSEDFDLEQTESDEKEKRRKKKSTKSKKRKSSTPSPEIMEDSLEVDDTASTAIPLDQKSASPESAKTLVKSPVSDDFQQNVTSDQNNSKQLNSSPRVSPSSVEPTPTQEQEWTTEKSATSINRAISQVPQNLKDRATVELPRTLSRISEASHQSGGHIDVDPTDEMDGYWSQHPYWTTGSRYGYPPAGISNQISPRAAQFVKQTPPLSSANGSVDLMISKRIIVNSPLFDAEDNTRYTFVSSRLDGFSDGQDEHADRNSLTLHDQDKSSQHSTPRAQPESDQTQQKVIMKNSGESSSDAAVAAGELFYTDAIRYDAEIPVPKRHQQQQQASSDGIGQVGVQKGVRFAEKLGPQYQPLPQIPFDDELESSFAQSAGSGDTEILYQDDALTPPPTGGYYFPLEDDDEYEDEGSNDQMHFDEDRHDNRQHPKRFSKSPYPMAPSHNLAVDQSDLSEPMKEVSPEELHSYRQEERRQPFAAQMNRQSRSNQRKSSQRGRSRVAVQSNKALSRIGNDKDFLELNKLKLAGAVKPKGYGERYTEQREKLHSAPESGDTTTANSASVKSSLPDENSTMTKSYQDLTIEQMWNARSANLAQTSKSKKLKPIQPQFPRKSGIPSESLRANKKRPIAWRSNGPTSQQQPASQAPTDQQQSLYRGQHATLVSDSNDSSQTRLISPQDTAPADLETVTMDNFSSGTAATSQPTAAVGDGKSAGQPVAPPGPMQLWPQPNGVIPAGFPAPAAFPYPYGGMPVMVAGPNGIPMVFYQPMPGVAGANPFAFGSAPDLSQTHHTQIPGATDKNHRTANQVNDSKSVGQTYEPNGTKASEYEDMYPSPRDLAKERRAIAEDQLNAYAPLPPIGGAEAVHEATVFQSPTSPPAATSSQGGAIGAGGSYMQAHIQQKQRKEFGTEAAGYRQYTIQDYRNLSKDSKPARSLGPDLKSDRFKEQADKRRRQLEYAKQLQRHQPPPVKKPVDEIVATTSQQPSKRDLALQYAKRLPKRHPVPKKSSSGTPDLVTAEAMTPTSTFDIITSRESRSGNTPAGDSSDELASLEELRQRHEQERYEVEKIRSRAGKRHNFTINE